MERQLAKPVVPPVTISGQSSINGKCIRTKIPINSTLSSDKFPVFPVSLPCQQTRSYMRLLCQQVPIPFSLLPISNVSGFRPLPLRVGKPLFLYTDGSIIPCGRRVRFVSSPLSYMKEAPIESTGIRLQHMQKLRKNTGRGLRYMLWYVCRPKNCGYNACACAKH